MSQIEQQTDTFNKERADREKDLLYYQVALDDGMREYLSINRICKANQGLTVDNSQS